MIKRVSLGLLVLALSTSCVSKKMYTDLENKFAELKKERNALSDENEALKTSKTQLENDNASLKAELEKTIAERNKLAADYAAASNNLKTLQDSYKALEKNSDEALKANMDKNRELLAKLEAKEKALAAEKARLEKLSADLKDRSDRVTELENIIAAKEASLKKLKVLISYLPLYLFIK